jgi:hypothetical protein
MKRIGLLLACVLIVTNPGFASSLGTASRNVIPKDVQQIITVDYRALRNSPTALALKDRVLPDNLKQFETALKGVGVDEKEVEQLTFASFRSKNGLRIVGIAQGLFPLKQVSTRLRLKKIKGEKYRTSLLYPMSGGMQMSFLDANTMLFGDSQAVKNALDARDGETESLNSNSQITDMMSAVDSGPVWSVLDALGTQTMMRSALGDAAQLADYEIVKKRLLGSRYSMDFSSGVNFDLDVVTADQMTAATLSSLIKAGMLYKRMTASGTEKIALDSVTVDSQSERLRLHFRSDEKRFQSLLQSDLFAAVSR